MKNSKQIPWVSFHSRRDDSVTQNKDKLKMSVKTRMKTFIVLSLTIIANASGNTLLSKGMRGLGAAKMGLPDLWRLVTKAATNPAAVLGIALLVVFYVLFLASLSWAELTFVLPVISFSYVVNAFSAKYLLGESIPFARWAGIILVSLGVYLVSKSGKRAEAA